MCSANTEYPRSASILACAGQFARRALWTLRYGAHANAPHWLAAHLCVRFDYRCQSRGALFCQRLGASPPTGHRPVHRVFVFRLTYISDFDLFVLPGAAPLKSTDSKEFFRARHFSFFPTLTFLRAREGKGEQLSFPAARRRMKRLRNSRQSVFGQQAKSALRIDASLVARGLDHEPHPSSITIR